MGKACICEGNDGSKEIEGFHVFEVQVRHPSRVMGAPVETGEVAIDNKVIDPVNVRVIGTVVADENAEDTIGKIEAMLLNREYELYSVCDGKLTYSDLILQELPFKRAAEKIDFYNFELNYTTAMIVQGKSSISENAENSSTRTGGSIASS